MVSKIAPQNGGSLIFYFIIDVWKSPFFVNRGRGFRIWYLFFSGTTPSQKIALTCSSKFFWGVWKSPILVIRVGNSESDINFFLQLSLLLKMAPKLAPQNGGSLIFYFIWSVWKVAFLVNQVGIPNRNSIFLWPSLLQNGSPNGYNSQFDRLCCENAKLLVI